jgi:hypothetical protein
VTYGSLCSRDIPSQSKDGSEKGENMTFRELHDQTEGSESIDKFLGGKMYPNPDQRLVWDCFWVLHKANRSYSDDGVQGNYLADFLAQHGADELQPIFFSGGSPHCKGSGVCFKE